jgi:hypothetical protein
MDIFGVVELLLQDGRFDPIDNYNTSLRYSERRQQWVIVRRLLRDKRVIRVCLVWK